MHARDETPTSVHLEIALWTLANNRSPTVISVAIT